MQISAIAEKLHDAEARRDAAQQSVQDAETQIAAAKKQVDQILGLVAAEPRVAVPPDAPGLVGVRHRLRRRHRPAQAVPVLAGAEQPRQTPCSTSSRPPSRTSPPTVTTPSGLVTPPPPRPRRSPRPRTPSRRPGPSSRARSTRSRARSPPRSPPSRPARAEVARAQYSEDRQLPRRRPAQRQRVAGDRLRQGRRRGRLLHEPAARARRTTAPGLVHLGVGRGGRQPQRLVGIDVREPAARAARRGAARRPHLLGRRRRAATWRSTSAAADHRRLEQPGLRPGTGDLGQPDGSSASRLSLRTLARAGGRSDPRRELGESLPAVSVPPQLAWLVPVRHIRNITLILLISLVVARRVAGAGQRRGCRPDRRQARPGGGDPGPDRRQRRAHQRPGRAVQRRPAAPRRGRARHRRRAGAHRRGPRRGGADQAPHRPAGRVGVPALGAGAVRRRASTSTTPATC